MADTIRLAVVEQDGLEYILSCVRIDPKSFQAEPVGSISLVPRVEVRPVSEPVE